MNATRIGRTLVITGEVDAGEDVVVLGRVEGSLHVRGAVEVDRRGRVRGDVRARQIEVSGEVEGPVTAEQRIEIRAEGSVVGDLRSPRIFIADGARFEGTVHMDRGRSDDE